MPQEPGAERKADAELAATMARLLEEVAAEPVPGPIRALANRLERVLQARHGDARKTRADPTQD